MTARGPRGGGDSLARLLLTQAGAVIAVTAILAGSYAWLGPDRGPGRSSDAARTASPSAPRSSTTASRPESPAPSPSAASPSASATGSSSPSAARSGPEVVVLNQSGRAGLAGQVADRLRAAGWTVSRVGNFSGSVSTSTVYYPSGKAAAARKLVRDLPGNVRVKSRFSNLSKTRLTVVLTRDYPG